VHAKPLPFKKNYRNRDITSAEYAHPAAAIANNIP